MAKLKNTSIKKINTDAPILEVKDGNNKNILEVNDSVKITGKLDQTGDVKIGVDGAKLEIAGNKITMTGEAETNGKFTQTGEVNIGPDEKKLSINSDGTNITGNASIGPNDNLKITVGENNKISLNGDTDITGKLVQIGGIEIKEGETSIIDTTETSKIKIIGELNQTGNVKLGGETCNINISESEDTENSKNSITINGDMISLNSTNKGNNSDGILLTDGKIEINSASKLETTNPVVKISKTDLSLENKIILNSPDNADPTDYYIDSNKLLLEKDHIKLGRVDNTIISGFPIINSLAYLDIENSYSSTSEDEKFRGTSTVNIFAGDNKDKSGNYSEISLGTKLGVNNGISIKNINNKVSSELTIGNGKVNITGELSGESAYFTEYNLNLGDLSNIRLEKNPKNNNYVNLCRYSYDSDNEKEILNYSLGSVDIATGNLTLGSNPTIKITNKKTGTDSVNPNITIATDDDNSTINLMTGETDKQKCEIIMDSSKTNDPSIKFKIGKQNSATRLYETFEIHEYLNGPKLALGDLTITQPSSSLLKIVNESEETVGEQEGEQGKDSYAVVIGSKSSTTNGGVAIGFKTKSDYHGIAIGDNANANYKEEGAYSGSIAIGYNAESGDKGVAIGRDAKTGAGTNINAGNQCTTDAYLCLGVGGETWAKATNKTNGFSTTSDYRDKTDFKPIESALSFINSLEPLTFRVNPRYKYYNNKGEFQEDDYRLGKQAGNRRLAGFKAQDVYQKMIDEYHDDNYAQIVDYSKYDNPEDTNDVYSMYTASLVPFLTRAIQEQEEIINKLETRITTLEKQLEINKEKE